MSFAAAAAGAQGAQTLVGAWAMREQGKLGKLAAQRRRAALEFEAAQQDQDAKQAIAIGQQASFEQQRQASLAASRALAVAAASGGGASDTTVANLIAKTKGEGVYRGAVALYQGEDQARKLRMSAAAKRYSGYLGEDMADREQNLGDKLALLNLAIGGGSLYGKYGGKFSSGTNDASDN